MKNIHVVLSSLFLLTACVASAQESLAPASGQVVPMPAAWRRARALATAKPRDVVVIVLDDVGQADIDDLEARGLVPNITALAGQGITFRQAYAQPVCSQARWAIQFGVYNFRGSGAGCTEQPDFPDPPLALTALAELDPSADSGLFGKLHLGGYPGDVLPWWRTPEALGVASYVFTPANLTGCGSTGYGVYPGQSGPGTVWLRADAAGSALVSTYEPDEVLAAFSTWWTSSSAVRKVGYLPFSLAHAPFHAPPGYSRLAPTRVKFENMIQYADTLLGQALSVIGPLDTDTLVVLVGDNGTPPQVAPDGSKAKDTTFERGVRVPFILAGGGLATSSSERLVSLVDILPTVAEFLGVAKPSGIDGLSVFDVPHPAVLMGEDNETSAPADSDYAAVGNFTGGQRWKLRRIGRPGAMVEQLYDLVADPDELSPLAPSSHATISNYLRNRMLAAGVP